MGARQHSEKRVALPPQGQRLIRGMMLSGWGAAAAFGITLPLLDIALGRSFGDMMVRMTLRWLVLSAIAIVVTVLFTRRAMRQVGQSLAGERVARAEAEALAELAASIASGNSIQDTLSTAAVATARLFSGAVRCSILLPSEDGLLRLAAWSHVDSKQIAGFAFLPGEGFNGTAFADGRLIRVDDVLSVPAVRSDVGRASTMRSMLAAPLIADQRTLGVLSVVSPEPSTFDAHDEQVLTDVARHIAIALVSAETRQSAQQEAAQKAAIIAQMADGVVVCDRLRQMIDCNLAAAEIFDMPQHELMRVGSSVPPWRMLTAEGVRIDAGTGPLSRAVRGEVVAAEYRILTPSGLERWVWATASPLRDSAGNLNGGILVLRDMAKRRQAIKALAESEDRYRRLVELCPDPIVVYDSGTVAYANAAAVALSGASSPDQLIGRSFLDFVPPEHRERALRSGNLLSETEATLGEGPLLRLDGEVIQVETTSMQVTYQGRPAIQSVIRDVTERKRAEQALAHQALHDALTGLPNRVLLMDRLQQAIASAERDDSAVSLLLMDLDRFKEVNDSLGHHAGDSLLQQVGARLRGALRQVDTIARLGGDEFAVILPRTGTDDVDTVASVLRDQLRAPFAVEGQPVIVGASIGIAVSPDHGLQAEALLRRADVAMYVAKRAGVGWAMYEPEQDRNSPDRLLLISELRRAIDRDELVLHYQPKVSLEDGSMAGVEALVRWQHPVRGLLSPDEFVPIAEQAALIESLSHWVLRTALAQAMSWRAVDLTIPVAVNMSMRSLQDELLPEKIGDLLRATDLPPSLLVLEITESMLMLDPARTRGILQRLRAMGIRIAIDDFGTGHSSLAYLKRLPVDEVKIDRAFVQDIANDATDRVIVRSTVDLARSLDLQVVAEGVEDRETAELLADIGCDQVQGYYVSPPLRGEALTKWAHARCASTSLPGRLAA